MKEYITSLTLAVSLLFSSALFAFDDHEKPKSLADMWVMVPNAGQQAQFEQAFKEHLKYRLSKKDPREWHVFVPTVGVDMNRYAVRFCCTSFKDVEAYNKWAKDNDIGKHWNETVAQYVASYEHFFGRMDFDNSHWPDDGKKYRYFAVTEYQVKMGKSESVEAGKKTLSDNAKAMKWPYLWSWSWTIGGEGGLNLVIPYENFEGMTPPDKSFGEALSEHLKDDAKTAEIFSNWSDNFSSTNYTIWSLRDDMSMGQSE
ncbi:hypothetical protein [Thalassotalea sp. Y01]|uniref:hypothetical protein n=1 Tax=Thalassotalea sp. Y01 TaxID=2729613 RepID=UPI00145E55FE|nr:hypothetical protein [Thalassotalea sp. Y01]NMP15601.1 hypothetical protein [Thalassotalea sp. Y01]